MTTEVHKQRVAVLMRTNWWLSYQATYPLGKLAVDSEAIVIQIPWIKTVRIKRSEIVELVPAVGWSGALRWIVMSGIKVVHTNPAEPSTIIIRVPDISRLSQALLRFGYKL